MSPRVSPAPGVRFEELDGEAVLLNLANERYFGLDEVGTRFWRHIQDDGDLDSVVAALLTEYEVVPERLRDDLNRLVSELAAAGLVTVTGDGAPASA